MLNRQSCFIITLRLSVLYVNFFFLLRIIGKILEHNGTFLGNNMRIGA